VDVQSGTHQVREDRDSVFQVFKLVVAQIALDHRDAAYQRPRELLVELVVREFEVLDLTKLPKRLGHWARQLIVGEIQNFQQLAVTKRVRDATRKLVVGCPDRDQLRAVAEGLFKKKTISARSNAAVARGSRVYVPGIGPAP
jgi:hypothetical protein